MDATYVSATTFTVVGDQTGIFLAGRRVKCNCGVDGYDYGTISGSVFDNPNSTITLMAASDDITANLESVEWSVVTPASTAEIKRYIKIRLLDKDTSHTVADGIGGDFRLKVAMTVLDVGCYFDTAGTTSVTTVEIFEAGSTILSTDITVDATEKTSETAATPPVISDSAIAADGIITFNISGIASGTVGKGLTIWMEVTIP